MCKKIEQNKMIEILEEFLAQNLVEKGIIKREDKQLYVFGLRQLFGFAINIITTIIIGALFNMIWQSLLFSLAYIPLRQYAGGYHASNSKTCFVLSITLVIIALIFIKNISVNLLGLLIVDAISIIIILKRAPVESKNKRLSFKEKMVFKKYARIIAIIEIILSILLFYIKLETLAKCILISIAISAILLLFNDN